MGSVAATTALKTAFDAFFGTGSPYLLFFGAAMAATWYGGFRPGLLACACGAVVGHYFFTTPTNSLLKPEWERNLLPAVFFVEAALICYLTDWLQRDSHLADANFQRLVDGTANHALILLDPMGRIASWNRGAQRVHGHLEAEVLGQPFSNLLPVEAAQKPQRLLDAAIANGLSKDEGWWLHKDGSQFWGVVTLTALRDAVGQVSHFVLATANQTERWKADGALRENERRLRIMADTLPVLIAYIDADGRYQFNNATYERWFGLHPDKCRGKHVRDVLGEPAYEMIQNRIALVLRGETQSYDAHLPYQHGGTRDVHVDCIPHFGPDGRVAGYYALIADISEQKKIEAALRVGEERLRAIVNTAPDAIITLNRRGSIESVNPATVRMFGYSAAELIGQNIGHFLPLPDQLGFDRKPEESARTTMRRLIKSGREVHAERKDGTTFPVELSVSETGSLGLCIGILRDVSRRLELEREVLEATAREQRRIGQELHDHVGQELTGLELLASALSAQLQSTNPADADLLARIVAGLRRVHIDVRSLARGLVPVDIHPNGLRAALESLAQRIGDQSGIPCQFDATGPVQVADPTTATHLVRIAQEAVSNALRHGQPTRILIELRSEAGVLALAVRDDGIGMPDHPLDDSGLGLHLMEYRASLIGGNLTIGPVEGGGTQILCRLANANRKPRDGRPA